MPEGTGRNSNDGGRGRGFQLVARDNSYSADLGYLIL
jgi:hypothetical protein